MSIRVEIQYGVATLTLDEPDRRNTLHAGMVKAIADAFDSFEDPNSGVRSVVITGAPPAFFGGADLGDLGAAIDDERRAISLRAVYESFLRVSRSPLPTV